MSKKVHCMEIKYDKELISCFLPFVSYYKTDVTLTLALDDHCYGSR